MIESVERISIVKILRKIKVQTNLIHFRALTELAMDMNAKGAKLLQHGTLRFMNLPEHGGL